MAKKLFPDPFLKNQNWAYIWIHSLTFCTNENYLNILKWSCRSLTFTSYKAFSKNKKSSETSLPTSISAWFLKKKYFSYYIVLPDQISLSGCLYFARYWAIPVLYCLLTTLWSHKSESNPICLMRPFFLHDKKSRQIFKHLDKSSHQRCSITKGVPRNFEKFTGKHLSQSLFFNKVAGLRPQAQLFTCEFCKICKNTFPTEHLRMTVYDLENKKNF